MIKLISALLITACIAMGLYLTINISLFYYHEHVSNQTPPAIDTPADFPNRERIPDTAIGVGYYSVNRTDTIFNP